MNRAQLESALRNLSRSHGYSFELMPADRMAEVRKFPAVVLEPPSVAGVEGRGHGRISYNVTLHLLALAAKLTAAERSEMQQKLESDLLDMLTELSENDRVIVVEDVGITPREFAFTTHGEISQSARAVVITHF